MSSGQMPRCPQFFPRMKRRGKGRSRPPRIVLFDHNYMPIWPPVIAGHDIRSGNLVFESSAGRRVFTGQYWVEENQ